MMGCGKSVLGAMLAQRLNLKHVDTDRCIEQEAAMTISALFAQYGEHTFRQWEWRVFQRLLDNGASVISAGGGAFIYRKTAQLLKRKALTLWLDVPLETLWGRVRHKHHRPLIEGPDPYATFEAIFTRRRPLYAQAHITVRCQSDSQHKTVQRILDALCAHAH